MAARHEVKNAALRYHLRHLDRRAIRQHFEHRFCAERMARDYLTIYEGLPAAGSRRLDSGVIRARSAEAAD
jgi:hypothetical protein